MIENPAGQYWARLSKNWAGEDLFHQRYFGGRQAGFHHGRGTPTSAPDSCARTFLSSHHGRHGNS
jgi:hypothetical protein